MNFLSFLRSSRTYKNYKRSYKKNKRLFILAWSVLMMGLALVIEVLALSQWKAPADGGSWVAVKSQPLERPVTAEGPLSEGTSVTVNAPFDGNIVQRWVQPGDHVVAGAPLLKLDTESIQSELREAQSANIRAQTELAAFAQWANSSEVTASQRALSSAQRQNDAAANRLAQIKTLFSKGIVARSELESAQSELASTSEQLESTKDSLASALQKGGPSQKKIAELEAESRSKKLEVLEARFKSATITAPVAGVVLRPLKTDGTSAKELDLGVFVTNREALMVIGDNTKFMVRSSLDEFDSARVRTGMPVEVSLNTDEQAIMRGELARVSSQARSNSGFGQGNGAPLFDIEVLIDKVPPELRSRLRLGMSTRLRIVVGQQTSVLTVPLQAVRMQASGQTTVRRRTPQDAPSSLGQEVGITTGVTLADSVQVLSGLKEGDQVWVSSSKASDIAASPQSTE